MGRVDIIFSHFEALNGRESGQDCNFSSLMHANDIPVLFQPSPSHTVLFLMTQPRWNSAIKYRRYDRKTSSFVFNARTRPLTSNFTVCKHCSTLNNMPEWWRWAIHVWFFKSVYPSFRNSVLSWIQHLNRPTKAWEMHPHGAMYCSQKWRWMWGRCECRWTINCKLLSYFCQNR